MVIDARLKRERIPEESREPGILGNRRWTTAGKIAFDRGDICAVLRDEDGHAIIFLRLWGNEGRFLEFRTTESYESLVNEWRAEETF